MLAILEISALSHFPSTTYLSWPTYAHPVNREGGDIVPALDILELGGVEGPILSESGLSGNCLSLMDS